MHRKLSLLNESHGFWNIPDHAFPVADDVIHSDGLLGTLRTMTCKVFVRSGNNFKINSANYAQVQPVAPVFKLALFRLYYSSVLI